MFLDDLPHSVLYDLCKYLSFNDIINLSKTCKQLLILIEDMFKTCKWLWIILNCKDNSDGYLAYRRIKKQK
jgi:hypothetical protein